MTDHLQVDPGGLAGGASAIDGLAGELYLNIDGKAVWADYLSVAGAAGVSAAVASVSSAIAARMGSRASAMRSAADGYGGTDISNAEGIRTVPL